MSINEFVDKANEILSDLLDEKVSLTADEPLSETIDSLAMMGFINAIENDFNVKFRLSQIKNFKTLEDIYNEYIAN